MSESNHSNHEDRADKVLADYLLRIDRGEKIDREQFLAAHPEVGEELRAYFAGADVLEAMANCGETPTIRSTINGQGLLPNDEEEPIPDQIDRYEILGRLGSGGFGTVYRGYDTELQRAVAIKVPRPARIRGPADLEAYLNEARLVAQLDHPHIVPVYDTGRTEDGLCFVVSKLISGSNLRTKIKQPTRDYREAASLVATIAEALHYAHGREITHRDIKPENILIDESGQPYVADFGLAIRDEDFGKGSGYAGTPLYWSPEQARGEGHRVDGRSDIFSLGNVFYELLTGKGPFRGSSPLEIADRIQHGEARPPRQLDDNIPRELERICLKALAKRAADRYTTAKDMARDLLHFLETSESQKAPQSAGIVPKGLRSFDAEDADFFLELLPGPRDRDGLPQSIRFWKTRIEQTDPDKTFSVGVLYGPSGCGKSSLVKAGLLPRLTADVVPVYIEATANDTEARLLRRIRKVCPAIQPEQDLVDAIATLRRGAGGLSSGSKVLLVIDQFEQWLHVHRSEEETLLVAALRHCDGGHVQCIVMVRDDFWLAISCFMQELEIRLIEAENSRLVNLFDTRHARSVLIKFGQAFGTLSAQYGELSPDTDLFLDQAISGLASDGKVVCVRLALFAEMVKGKPWSPKTLNEVGGTEGIGVTFLEETFSASTAPPVHRLYQKAAREVLKSLLPTTGTDIKGGMRSYDELLDASGYSQQQEGFQELIQILDSELRLITPTDPSGQEADNDSKIVVDPTKSLSESPSLPIPLPASGARVVSFGIGSKKYYQLTHDYLVPSLREWLTRKQKETWRGRAELCPQERTDQWHRTKIARFLPDPLEYVTIQAGVPRRKRTPEQKSVMQAATRRYGSIATLVAVVILLLGWVIWELNGRIQSNRLVQAIQSATPAQLEKLVVEDLPSYRRWADPVLRQKLQNAESDPSVKLKLSLAMLPVDSTQLSYLHPRLLDCSVEEFPVIRNSLRSHKAKLVGKLWTTLRKNTERPECRFHAGMALADYARNAKEWAETDTDFLVSQLLNSNPDYQRDLRGYLTPISPKLLTPLEAKFRDSSERDSIREAAASALANFAADDPVRLAMLASEATPTQYRILFPLLVSNFDEAAKKSLKEIAAKLPGEDMSSIDRVSFGQRRAGAGITLLRLGERESVLPTFNMTDDPEALTQFIHRCRDRDVRAEELLECLQLFTSSSLTPQASPLRPHDSSLTPQASLLRPHDSSLTPQASRLIRYALLLALGQYPLSDIPEANRDSLIKQLGDWYLTDPNSAVHGATGWLLLQWGQEEIVRRVDQTQVDYSADREWFTLAIQVTPQAPVTGASRSEEENAKGGMESAETHGKDEQNDKDSDQTKENQDVSEERASDAAAIDGTSVSVSEPARQTIYMTFVILSAGEYL
ncbi:MAG: serine/threonine-protein kinase, partial [Pirellulales bacterium]|nr:serine/threonine-protein kinase [Pirellulales bacterium]